MFNKMKTLSTTNQIKNKRQFKGRVKRDREMILL